MLYQIILFSLLIELTHSTTVLRDKRYDDENHLLSYSTVVRGKRWKKQKLVWQLNTRNLMESDVFVVRNTLHRAFNEWAKVSSLKFEEFESDKDSNLDLPQKNVDIEIGFEKGNHEDGYPFDGQDGVVAHAFYPRDGRLHFDADEQWSLNSDTGVNLFQTAVHEIGHLLGLEHSMDIRAAMYAAKRPYDPSFGLGDDDVRAIRALFPIISTTTPTIHQSTNTPTKHKNDYTQTTIHPNPSPNTITPTREENDLDPFDPSDKKPSFFPFPLPSLENFQRRADWFVH